MVERAYYPMKIDGAMVDDVLAMESINYPISVCYVAVDRYDRAFLEVPFEMGNERITSFELEKA